MLQVPHIHSATLTVGSKREDFSGISQDIACVVDGRSDCHSASTACAFDQPQSVLWLLRARKTIGGTFPGGGHDTDLDRSSPLLATANVYGSRKGVGQWMGDLRDMELAVSGKWFLS